LGATLKSREDVLKAKEQGRDKDPQVQRQILRAWFARLMPLRGPDGRVLAAPDRRSALVGLAHLSGTDRESMVGVKRLRKTLRVP
jgi:hypothetical protein